MAENNPSAAHLFIVNPLYLRTLDNLFSTHPSTENRIHALQEVTEGRMKEGVELEEKHAKEL